MEYNFKTVILSKLLVEFIDDPYKITKNTWEIIEIDVDLFSLKFIEILKLHLS